MSKYHPAWWLLAAAPILVWFGINVAAFALSLRTRLRRARAIRERLAALQAEGFAAQLVCKGDLARGGAWAAFDRREVKILSEDGVRSFELSRLASVMIDETHRLGDPTPLYYSLSLSFGDPGAPASIATASRREAERWRQEIAALTAPPRPPSPGGAA